MDILINIFKSLGVDGSIVPQFITVLVLFFLLKTVLFSRLQEILELRESKTTKLDDGANKKFIEAEELSRNYSLAIEEASAEAQIVLDNNKKEVNLREAQNLSSAEAEIEKDLNLKRDEFTQELQEKRTHVMKDAVSLSSDLVSKLTH